MLDWFETNYAAAEVPTTPPDWAASLTDVRVKIFLGTWCGDSQRWVPRFLHLWKALGLPEDQLELTALYNGDARYKQGPHGEEVGYRIHRVPTFIFFRDSTELGRIVERPHTSLLTDLAQIALGYPASPEYFAANYLTQILADHPLDSIRTGLTTHLRQIQPRRTTSGELNTLGYVYLRANQIRKALLVFLP